MIWRDSRRVRRPRSFDVSALQAKMDRLDALLDRKLADREAEQARADASLEDARRQRQRANAEARREIQAGYADAYRSFGTEVPAPVDDESPMSFRKRLFNRLARRLPSGHDLADVRADDLGSQPVVLRKGRPVERIVDRNSGQTIWGKPF
jgi:hypothetical protein